MNSTSGAARERRLRRTAARLGLSLTKAHSRNPEAPDYGTYGIVSAEAPGGHWRSRVLVVGDPPHGYGLSLDDVEAELVERA